LSGAVWDEDSARDHVRAFVARHLGDGGMLIFDEIGDLKKGDFTAETGDEANSTSPLAPLPHTPRTDDITTRISL
jgi:hypothetical protein